jgi:hypothetical protein
VTVANYDDGRVKCTDQGIIIRRYYIPSGDRPSGIRTSARHAKCRCTGSANGAWREPAISFTGSTSIRAVTARNRKETALVIYTDGRIRPVITPDDPALVAGELTTHGVNVTKGRERGFI